MTEPKRRNRSDEELAMRRICESHLRARWPDARLIHEFPLRYSTRSIDLAAVTQDKIIAVEIKSSRDTLERLDAQLVGFAPICTRIFVALAPRWNEQLPSIQKQRPKYVSYEPQLTEAQRIIARVRRTAPWIATWTCDAAQDEIRLTSSDYYENHHPWTRRLLDVLHVAELVRIAEHHGVASARPAHDRLCDALVGRLTEPQIVRACCAALRARDAFCAGTDAPEALAEPVRQDALL